MEFRILGPLQVLVDERPVDIAGPKLRTLLAALLLQGGRVVAKDRLFEILWGPQPPDSAGPTLQSHVSHLRDALEPERRADYTMVLSSPGNAAFTQGNWRWCHRCEGMHFARGGVCPSGGAHDASRSAPYAMLHA